MVQFHQSSGCSPINFNQLRPILLANGDDEVFVVQSEPTHLYVGDVLNEERLKAAFLKAVTFDSGDRPDEDWWESATWPLRAANCTSIVTPGSMWAGSRLSSRRV